MPNWVYNGLTIEGKPEQVKALITQMNKPYVNYVEAHGDLSFGIKQIKYTNPIFAFRNIYSYVDAGVTKEEYIGQPPRNDGESFAEFMQFKTNDWYNFNNREWGTKWDVGVSDDESYSNTNMEEAENGENYVVHYNFETAWSRPLPALKKLSAQYPNLLMTLSYEEETGWGGEMEFLRGEVISESEYDNMCRDCDATNCMEYCENDCGEICNVCHWLGEADLDAVAECEDHKQYLEDKVPLYRKQEV